jgi:hypothetical protein
MTRGQLAKVVVLAEGWSTYVPPSPTFRDVSADNPFYIYVETAFREGVVTGYDDGTFRWGNGVTRGQICKVLVLARDWPLYTPVSPTFNDVAPENPFYAFIETAYCRGTISGYADGTFRPGSVATRGQVSKIVYGALSSY